MNLLADAAVQAARRQPAPPKPWWAFSDDPYALVRQLDDPYLHIPFERLLEAVGKVLGRAVAPHELAEPFRLRLEVRDLFRRVA